MPTQGHNPRHGLTNDDVHAGYVPGILSRNNVDRHRGLANIAVADDQLALSTTNGNGRIDRHDSRQESLIDRRPLDDFRGNTKEWTGRMHGWWRALVQWIPQGIENASQNGGSHR